MGVERIANPVSTKNWQELKARFTERGYTPIIRMIDGQPAFPDELPPDDWQELRLGFPQGMLTLRAISDVSVSCTIWGNGDSELRTMQELCIELLVQPK